MGAGIPDELFWRLTIPEVQEVLKRQGERNKESWRQAATVAAAIYNVNRKPGSSMLSGDDLLREAPREEDYLDMKSSMRELDAWAASVNADFKQGRRKERQVGEKV